MIGRSPYTSPCACVMGSKFTVMFTDKCWFYGRKRAVMYVAACCSLRSGGAEEKQSESVFMSINLFQLALFMQAAFKSLCSVFQLSLSVTLVLERVTCCPASPETSSTWRARAPSGLSLPHAASRWMARRWRPRSGTRPARSATVPSRQREWASDQEASAC